VVVDDRRPPGQGGGHRLGRLQVERERADVLGDDQVGVIEGAGHFVDGGRLVGVDGQVWEDAVGAPRPGHRDYPKAQGAEGARPLGRLD
jgi:hypothetical protein